MSKHLERDLEALEREILAQSSLVEEMIAKACRGLVDRRVDLSSEVIASEVNINTREVKIEEECLKILALHQPVATDLRRTTSIMFINTDLERMADLAVEMAERAVDLIKPPHIPVSEDLHRMSDLATSMLRQSLDAFVKLDATHARRVVRLDDEVDHYNVQIINTLIGIMKKSPENIAPALSLFSVVRQLERIADHATNIAEDVVYLVEGEIIRHRPEASRDDD